MALSLYNDLTRKKEIFVPLVDRQVNFYSCGPTVYDYFHIGNARPFIVFDALRRYMEYSGYNVTFVQNFTDIDDKIIDRANRDGISMAKLSEKNIADYFEDADALGVHRATHHPRATEYVGKIIDLIQRIIDKGHGYVVNGTVYFDVNSFPSYGRLSRQNIAELQSGARIEVDTEKKSPLDFVLWKPQKPGEPAWDSPWGPGRPGWHIECSAMSMDLLGDTIDIHAGGVDLTFPHHENEIAQTEAATGKPFVNFWLHNEYILIDREKMSKSLGNFLTAREARQRYSPLAIRMFMLSAHYRSPVNFSDEGLEQASAAVERLHNCWGDLQFAKANRPFGSSDDLGLVAAIDEGRRLFCEDLDDDFNTAGAMGALFDVVKAVNTYFKNATQLSEEAISSAESFFMDVENIMGLFAMNSQNDDDSAGIEALIARRREARAAKDFAASDAIRDELIQRGIILEDTPNGTKWKRKL